MISGFANAIGGNQLSLSRGPVSIKMRILLQVFGVFIILWQNQYTSSKWSVQAVSIDLGSLLLQRGWQEWPIQNFISSECKPLENTTPLLRLKKYLFCEYSSDVRSNHHKAVSNVTLRLIPKIMEFEDNGVMTLHAWMSLSWTDAYLTWAPSSYDGVTYIHVKNYDIWAPDLNIFNSGDMSNDLFELPDTDCLLLSTGVISCVPVVKIVSKCEVDYTYWPYDQQTCRIVFGSWSHSGEEIDFHLDGDGISMDSYENNTAWDLKFVDATRRVLKFHCCPNDTFPQIIYEFSLIRHYGVTRSTLITPTIALIVLTLTVLWLDSRSVERMAVASSNFICHLLCIMDLHWQLPYNAGDTPNIMLFYRESLALATFALILTALLRKLQSTSTKIPSWISHTTTFVLSNKAGRFLILNNEESKIPDGDLVAEEISDISKSAEKIKEPASWRHFAAIVEWMSFFCVILTYIIILIILIPTS